MTKVFFAASTLTALLAGCAVDQPTYESTEGDSYEEWKSKLQIEPSTGKWLLDWDIVVGDEELLYQHWQDSQSGQALSIYRLNGVDVKWSDAQKINLTYCISTATFGANKQLVIDAMKAASDSGWEAFANVNFVYVPAQDANCTAANTNVLFDVNQVNSGGQYLARAFFPNSARADRNVLIDPGSYNSTVTLTNILIHELGHTLGFRHEHIARPGQATQGCVEDQNYRVLETYDQVSTMHYPQCGSPGNTLALSAKDKTGVALVYGTTTAKAPTATVTNPTNNQQVANTFRVEAMVVAGGTSTISKVELFIDQATTAYQTLTAVGANGLAVFESVTIAQNGTHTLNIKATGGDGLTTTTQMITVNVQSSGGGGTGGGGTGGGGTGTGGAQDNDVTGGCSTGGGSVGILFALGFLGLAIRRRR